MLLICLLGGSILIPFVAILPLDRQRDAELLPLPVDPVARASAERFPEWPAGNVEKCAAADTEYLGWAKVFY